MKTLLFVFLFIRFSTLSQTDSLRGLQTDIMLHPCDAFTAYTLKKNEFVYNQSPMTLPVPSWAWWGITDKITMEFDLLPLLGGLLQEPFLPVPSFNFRFKLLEQKNFRPHLAYEFMIQHLWTNQNQLDVASMRIERNGGTSFYNHLNASWLIRPKLHLHVSTGVTYTQNLLIESKDSVNYSGKFFKQTVNPDFSVSIDYRPKPWISAHLTSSYGTTFVFLDNIPRKYQIGYGFRVAPFYKNKYGFLRTFRFELTSLYMYFPDAKESLNTYLPIFPYFYWQWKCNKKKK